MRPTDLPTDIAIVGIAATFAGARDVGRYWENILGKVDAVHEAPDSWAAPYFDPTSKRNDRIYTRRGGFLGELAEFDPKEFGIMPNSVDGGEPDQYLALKLARDALRDAGYLDRPFDRARTGVIFGRGTYVNRGYTSLMQHGLVVDQTLELLRQVLPQLGDAVLEELRQALKSSLPAFTAENCPGMVPNIVSGRVANRLDLMGPNFIIDAACASSLIAMSLALEELRSGRCDMMLTGGIHASTPPQIYMIFCQLGGLSREAIRPFDARAQGTLLGEGMGVMVLKRLADAERDGDRIYALIKGVGVASDGKALGLLAPRLEGEITALRRAYEASGVDPASIGLVEAHGTGIPLGDETEVRALATLFGQRGEQLPRVALGSVKSMIGHCIPAAGAAGMIKAALSLYHKVLPPTLAQELNPALGIESTAFYVNNETRPWIHGDGLHPRRAGVNAFGFGGINAHVVLEEYRGPAQGGSRMLHVNWPSELVVAAAATQAQLTAAIEALAAAVRAEPTLPLWELARRASVPAEGAHRAAIVCRSREDLLEKCHFLCEKLRGGATRVQARSGVFYAQAAARPKTAFLFPGEGAQYADMLSDLCLYFPGVRAWFDFLDATFAGERDYLPSAIVFPPPTALTASEREKAAQRLYGMDLGSELCFIAGMALYELLTEFGLKADVMLGHSTGENTALVASGTLRLRDREQLGERVRDWNVAYRDLEESGDIPRGALVTVGGVSRETLEHTLAASGGAIHLAMDNCPNQAVLFGPTDVVTRAQEALTGAGGICMPLPFDRGYHTPLFERAGARFRRLYDMLDMVPGHTPLMSCATCELFPRDTAGIRALAQRQWSSRVRFRESVEALYRLGLRAFVEVGPSANLTSFVEDSLRGRELLAVASNSRRRPGLEQLQTCLARLHVQGWSLDLAPLFRHRAPASDGAAAPAAGAKGKPVLKLELPRLELSDSFLARVRGALAQEQRPAQAERPSVAAGPVDAPAAGAAAVGAPARDARTAALVDHFALMQQFLDSQRSLLDLLGGQAPAGDPAASAVVAKDTRWPMLGRIESEQPDALVCEREVSLVQDPYLHDHTLGSAPSARDGSLTALPVVPFTFSMEMLAQAALRLAGPGKVILGMEALRGYRWLTLDRDVLPLRIEARRLSGSEERFAVRIFQHNDQGPLRHLLVFEGQVRVGAAAAVPASERLQLGTLKASKQRDDQLYSNGMFHGPRLRGVTHIRGWSEQGIEADLITLPTEGFFAGPVRLATDAGLLDAAGQLVGYWLSEQFGSDFNCFPFEVGAYEQYAPPPAPGQPVVCRAQIRFTGPQQLEANLELVDREGRLLARLLGWRDRYFSMPERYYRTRLHPQQAYLSESWPEAGQGAVVRRAPEFPDDLLELSFGIWGRVLAHLVLAGAERAAFQRLPVEGKRRGEWLLARICAKDAVRQWARAAHGVDLAPADVELATDARGKPFVQRVAGVGGPLPDISLAHSQGLAVAALVPPGATIGVDVQRTRAARPADVVAGGFDESERRWLGASGIDGPDHAAVLALWCAKEAAAKAAGLGFEGNPKRWIVVGYDPRGGAEVEHAGRVFQVRLHAADETTFAICVNPAAGDPAASPAPTPALRSHSTAGI
jgi:acyl transferase domain-containing protein/phosphopantetheinyl transferase